MLLSQSAESGWLILTLCKYLWTWATPRRLNDNINIVNIITNITIVNIITNINIVNIDNIVSSKGALYVIMPYDYPAQRPLFEQTSVLNNNFEY